VVVGAIRWYRTPVEKETLKRLVARSNFKGLLQSVAFVVIYLLTTGTTLFLFVREMWVGTAIAAYVHCMFVGFVGMGAAVHELSHGTVFKSRRLNDFFYRLFAFLSWNSHVHFRLSHTRHHQLTSYDGKDLENPENPVPFSWWNVVQWFTFDFGYFRMLVWTTIQHALGNTDRDYFYWKPLVPADHPDAKRLTRWARVVILGHALTIAASIASGLWILVITVSLAPFIGGFLIHFCQMQQHIGLRRNVPDWRVNAYSAEFGPVMRFLYWNMNYHSDHHMYAAVPFYNLPELHAAIRADLPVPIQGFWKGVVHIFRVKRRHDADSSYRFVPEFPPGATPPHVP
jgi:fatty acid desaturase